MNIFKSSRSFQSPLEETKSFGGSKRVEPNRDRLCSVESEEVVQAHVRVLRRDLEQREDD